MRRKSWVMFAGGVVGALALGWVFERPLMKMVLGHSTGAGVEVSAASKVVYDFGGVVGVGGVPAPWDPHTIAGTMQVKVVDVVGGKGLEVTSDKAHFILMNGSQKFDAKAFPMLAWQWKAEELPVGGDVRTHDEFRFSSANRNDQALQVLIGFEGDYVLSYVWDTTAPVGTELDEWSPVATIKTRVVETGTGKVGEWVPEEINVYEDYKRRFGVAPGKVLGVSVQTNSNHTGTMGRGVFGVIEARGKNAG